MKKLCYFFLLFFSLSFYGQRDTISVEQKSTVSVVSADKMNVVYRGLPNPISISLSNNQAFTASAPGLSFKSEGKYIFMPGSGNETVITVVYKDEKGKSIYEKHKFRIKNIPPLYGKINGLYCNQSLLLMTKNELFNSVLAIGFPDDFNYEINFELKQFVVEIDNKSFVIEGNKFSKEVTDLISKLKVNSVFRITDFKSQNNCENCSVKPIHFIDIIIVKDDYFKNDEFEK